MHGALGHLLGGQQAVGLRAEAAWRGVFGNAVGRVGSREGSSPGRGCCCQLGVGAAGPGPLAVQGRTMLLARSPLGRAWRGARSQAGAVQQPRGFGMRGRGDKVRGHGWTVPCSHPGSGTGRALLRGQAGCSHGHGLQLDPPQGHGRCNRGTEIASAGAILPPPPPGAVALVASGQAAGQLELPPPASGAIQPLQRQAQGVGCWQGPCSRRRSWTVSPTRTTQRRTRHTYVLTHAFTLHESVAPARRASVQEAPEQRPRPRGGDMGTEEPWLTCALRDGRRGPGGPTPTVRRLPVHKPSGWDPQPPELHLVGRDIGDRDPPSCTARGHAPPGARLAVLMPVGSYLVHLRWELVLRALLGHRLGVARRLPVLSPATKRQAGEVRWGSVHRARVCGERSHQGVCHGAAGLQTVAPIPSDPPPAPVTAARLWAHCHPAHCHRSHGSRGRARRPHL